MLALGMGRPWKARPGCWLGLAGTWRWMKEGPSAAVLSPPRAQGWTQRYQSLEPARCPHCQGCHQGWDHNSPVGSISSQHPAWLQHSATTALLLSHWCLLSLRWPLFIPCWLLAPHWPLRMPCWLLLCLCPTRRKPWDHANHTLLQGQITLCLSLTPGVG